MIRLLTILLRISLIWRLRKIKISKLRKKKKILFENLKHVEWQLNTLRPRKIEYCLLFQSFFNHAFFRSFSLNLIKKAIKYKIRIFQWQALNLNLIADVRN